MPQRAGGVAELLVEVRYVRQLQEPSHVVVVADIAGKNTFGEHSGRNDQIRGVLPQHAEPRPSPLVQRRDAFDAASVEDDDQPVALCTLRAGFT